MYKGRTVIDVRTREEYMGGHVTNSINIPMQEVVSRLEEIKQFNNPILCCASGGRSEQVVQYLKAQGFECENGGGWMEVNYQLAIEDEI